MSENDGVTTATYQLQERTEWWLDLRALASGDEGAAGLVGAWLIANGVSLGDVSARALVKVGDRRLTYEAADPDDPNDRFRSHPVTVALPDRLRGVADMEIVVTAILPDRRKYGGRARFTPADRAESAMVDYRREKLRRRVRHVVELELAPACIAPGCAEKARVQFQAAEPGRLAGRDWEAGDAIDVCPKHGNDIYRAQGVYGINQLAEWLRPDANLDPLDEYDVACMSYGGDEVRAQRSRTLAVRRPA